MWKHPSGSFEIDNPWPSQAIVEPSYKTDPEKKRQFGVALSKGLKPLEAAMQVFADTVQALWASQNWLNDPIVVGNLKSEENTLKLLDKEALAAKVLAFVDERYPNGIPVNEGKDRVAALKLYAEICGYTSKVEIDNSVKNIDNRTMTIKLVSPEEKKQPVMIEASPIQEEVSNVLPLRVKLVP